MAIFRDLMSFRSLSLYAEYLIRFSPDEIEQNPQISINTCFPELIEEFFSGTQNNEFELVTINELLVFESLVLLQLLPTALDKI